ncbi:aminoglycoside phosphotransferase family protein [Gryllotalpicola protaetiae]|uniref:aminoglycoside phosphotransferase family protein n=1 Tax=Gryllotalpicola protaetiae TaxID=2419771 RepID=UPI001FE8F643|nr:aminoglycoside phosphotransferase family protein [Gryllotalpicola protaetiae]
MDIPHADLTVDEDLAARLVRAQFPALAGPVTPVAQGWDNALFRLGDELAIRMPRREVAAHLIEHEQRWLPELQRLVALPLPVPIAEGRPTAGYPFAWSVIPWVDGIGGAHVSPHARDAYARQLAGFLAALHVPASADAPHNPVRGVPLVTRAAAIHARLDGLAGRLAADELAGLRAAWDAGAATAPHKGPALWLHGDPHPGNVVVAPSGRLATVVDFGDVTAGDPATDLAAAWLHFTPAGRAAFIERYSELRATDAALWVRARAWAVSIGTSAFAASDGSGPMARMGREAIEQLLRQD